MLYLFIKGATLFITFLDIFRGEQEQQPQDNSADWTERPDAPAEAVESGYVVIVLKVTIHNPLWYAIDC